MLDGASWSRWCRRLLRSLRRLAMRRATLVLPSVLVTVALTYLQQERRKRRLGKGALESMVLCNILSWPLLEKGRVEKRTLFELSVGNLFSDPALSQVVKEAVQSSCHAKEAGSPCAVVLPLPDVYRWIVYNAVLNQISTKFAEWHVFADAGMPMERVWYVFALLTRMEHGAGRYFALADSHEQLPATFEVRLQRLRIPLLREDSLRAVAKGEVQPPREFESERHAHRWSVVQELAALYVQHSEDAGHFSHAFMRIEVPVPLQPGARLGYNRPSVAERLAVAGGVPQSSASLPHIESWDFQGGGAEGHTST